MECRGRYEEAEDGFEVTAFEVKDGKIDQIMKEPKGSE